MNISPPTISIVRASRSGILRKLARFSFVCFVSGGTVAAERWQIRRFDKKWTNENTQSLLFCCFKIGLLYGHVVTFFIAFRYGNLLSAQSIN